MTVVWIGQVHAVEIASITLYAADTIKYSFDSFQILQ